MMMSKQVDDSANPWAIWLEASAQPVLSDQLVALYSRLDQAIAQRGPVCWASGLCCHFDAFGHRLYVTGLEIAWMLRRVSLPSGEVDLRGACPFQVEHRCTVHQVRPLGCRVFFCQRGTEAWQQEIYEQFLADLRRLHDEYRLPYHYMEWRAGLAEAIRFSSGVNPAPLSGGE